MGPAVGLRRVGSLALVGVCVFATLSVGVLAFAEGARAGLHPDPPKPPPPPPPAAAPAPDPVLVAPPAALPPPPANVTPTSPEPAPAPPPATHSTKQVRALVTSRAARAHAQAKLRLKERRAARAAAGPVRTPATRRPAAGLNTISSPPSHTGTLLAFVLSLLAIGLVVVGRILGRAEAFPWPEPARMLVERRGEITFAGLGILAACSAVALLLLFAS